MTTKDFQVRALAQFFDDIRLEIGGKLILIGQYTNELIIPRNSPILIDRLAILVTIRWPRDFSPKEVSIKAELTGQPPIVQELPRYQEADFAGKPPSPFSGITLQMPIHCRFLPLRPGDFFDVWVVVDGTDVPAGRLGIALGPEIQHTTEALVPV